MSKIKDNFSCVFDVAEKISNKISHTMIEEMSLFNVYDKELIVSLVSTAIYDSFISDVIDIVKTLSPSSSKEKKIIDRQLKQLMKTKNHIRKIFVYNIKRIIFY